MCFFRRLQRHNITTSFFNTLIFIITFTHTHTHAHDWPTVAARSSGSRFLGFANIFDPKKGRKSFLDRQGVTQHPKIFPECYKCFQLFMYVFFFFDAGIMLHLLGYVR